MAAHVIFLNEEGHDEALIYCEQQARKTNENASEPELQYDHNSSNYHRQESHVQRLLNRDERQEHFKMPNLLGREMLL